MLFIYLYHGDLYSSGPVWKSDLYFRPAICEAEVALTSPINNINFANPGEQVRNFRIYFSAIFQCWLQCCSL